MRYFYFSIDSLLDYLNGSMILNKHEFKRLYQQQRNLLLMSSNHNANLLSYNPKVRSRPGAFYHPNQLSNSSGYNSENHSSNSTTSSSTNCPVTTTASTTNQFNFYRLSLSHLPLHTVHNQCTCGAQSNANSSAISVCSGELSPLINERAAKTRPLSSSPNLDDEDDDEDEDEDDEDLDEDLDEDEDEDLNSIQMNQSILNKTPTTVIDIPAILIETSSVNNNLNPDTVFKKSNDDIRFHFPNVLHRAPGTSYCNHTVRIDVRRVRSYLDLSQLQMSFSPSDFVFKEKLGEGFFANVKKIVFKKTNKEMVLKELKLSCIKQRSPANIGDDVELCEETFKVDFLLNYAELNAAHKSFLKEAQVLRNLNHPNVIKLMGIMFTKEKHLNLVLEYISGGTLKDIIHNISNVLPWKLRVGYAKDIAAALEYLHSLNIIHRDLKSDNCLVRENGRTVVVADFGLSRINYSSNVHSDCTIRRNMNDSSSSCSSLIKLQNSLLTSNLTTSFQSPQSSATNSFIVAAKRKLKRRGDHTNHHQRKQKYAIVGNSFSMAPEMLKHQIYDERVDIFSFGIICCEVKCFNLVLTQFKKIALKT